MQACVFLCRPGRAFSFPHLERGQRIDAATLRAVMETDFRRI
jgi:hypothetical protein